MAINAEEPRAELPVAVVLGDRAVTVQDYAELNCKAGAQFESSTYVAALAPAGIVDFIVEVGALPILIKGRQIQFTEGGVRLEVYKTPVYTGGSVVPYYNLNKWTPNTGLGVIRAGATVTNVGTQCSPHRDLVGSTAPGVSTLSTLGEEAPGLEAVLEPGAKYLFRAVNTGSTACKYSAYSTWYEGLLDVQQ